MRAQGKLIVSVHDVAPSHIEQVRYLLNRCDALGARPRVLKVIPNEDGQCDIREYPDFVAMLRREQAAGSEIVLHGFTHRIARPVSGWGLTALRARLFAPTIAEFATLDDREMAQRLATGRQTLLDEGLDIQGFCAPGWLAGSGLVPQLRKCGLRYCVSMLTLLDISTGRRLLTPWSGYMGADATQERLIRLGSRACGILASHAPAAKIFFHPQGAQESPDCARAFTTLQDLLHTRRPVTYASLLAARP